VLPLNIAALAQSLAERGQDRCIEAGRPAAQIADHRHFPLLCGACTRQQDGRAREHQEIASPHPVTSSTQPPAGISDEALALHVALVKPGIPKPYHIVNSSHDVWHRQIAAWGSPSGPLLA